MNNKEANLKSGSVAESRAAEFIHYGRGHFKTLGRSIRETRVCECYSAVKKEYDRLLPYRLSSALTATVQR